MPRTEENIQVEVTSLPIISSNICVHHNTASFEISRDSIANHLQLLTSSQRDNVEIAANRYGTLRSKLSSFDIASRRYAIVLISITNGAATIDTLYATADVETNDSVVRKWQEMDWIGPFKRMIRNGVEDKSDSFTRPRSFNIADEHQLQDSLLTAIRAHVEAARFQVDNSDYIEGIFPSYSSQWQFNDELVEVSLSYLARCTDNFSENNRIGTGAFGDVFVGNDGAFRFAVKRLNRSSDSVNNFDHEVNVLRRLRHENIVRVLGCSRDDANNHIECIVLEYADGGSLATSLTNDEKARRLDVLTRLCIITDIVSAVHYLHMGVANVILHRDIKTANVVLCGNKFTAKLIDCSLSELFQFAYRDATSTVKCLTDTGVKGSLSYLCPTYIRTNKYDVKSEIYSLGVTILEVISGRLAGDSGYDPVDCVESDELKADPRAGDWPPELLEQLVRLAKMCIQSNSKWRPNTLSVMQFVRSLEARFIYHTETGYPSTLTSTTSTPELTGIVPVAGGLLGIGNGGSVSMATWHGVNVAIKKLNNVNQSTFDQEIAIMCNLRHPNVIVFYGVYREAEASASYIVMEYSQIGSLDKYINNPDNQLDEKSRLSLALNAANGMRYLSSRNVVHGDVAARNMVVFCDKFGAPTVKVIDFGLARNAVDGGDRIIWNCWSAPETVSNGEYSLKSDVWMFGMMLWEIYTGRHPYDWIAKNDEQTLKAEIESGKPLDRPENCSNETYELMNECWRRDPDQRPTFEEIVDKLNRITNAVYPTPAQYHR